MRKETTVEERIRNMAEVLIHGPLSTAFRSIDSREPHRGWEPETFEKLGSRGRIGGYD